MTILKIRGSHRLVNSVLKVGVWVLLLKERHVKFSLINGALMQMTLDMVGRSVLFPVIYFKSLLHLIVLVFVPE